MRVVRHARCYVRPSPLMLQGYTAKFHARCPHRPVAKCSKMLVTRHVSSGIHPVTSAEGGHGDVGAHLHPIGLLTYWAPSNAAFRESNAL